MSWALFFQIEVIILTAGLVMMFILSVYQGLKDNSFFKRTSGIAKAMSETMDAMQKKQNESQLNAFKEFLKSHATEKKGEGE